MNYILKSKEGLVFAEKHESEDRLWVKLSVLENGSDVDWTAYNLFSVATIWSVFQESSLNLKAQDTPLSFKDQYSTSEHLPEKSIFSIDFPQITLSFCQLSKLSMWIQITPLQGEPSSLHVCVLGWGQLGLASLYLSGREFHFRNTLHLPFLEFMKW